MPANNSTQTLVIDLDGTLLDCNSLTKFVPRLIRILVSKGFVFQAIVICGIVVIRKLRICSHRCAKWHIMDIADRHISNADYLAFAQSLMCHIRDMFRQVRQSDTTILATAAPEQYARHIAETNNFDYCIATPMSNTCAEYAETRGQGKLNALISLLAEHPELDGSHLHLFTDHPDDSPLIEYTKSRGGKVTIVS